MTNAFIYDISYCFVPYLWFKHLEIFYIIDTIIAWVDFRELENYAENQYFCLTNKDTILLNLKEMTFNKLHCMIRTVFHRCNTKRKREKAIRLTNRRNSKIPSNIFSKSYMKYYPCLLWHFCLLFTGLYHCVSWSDYFFSPSLVFSFSMIVFEVPRSGTFFFVCFIFYFQAKYLQIIYCIISFS